MASSSASEGWTSLPGRDIVDRGLNDLAAGRETAAALLVRMAAPRLRGVGLEIPEDDDPGAAHRLYDLLAADDPRGAHSAYNALVGRMVSFARAAERAQAG